MHITDWKSTAWLRALGQKSSSIVDDIEFRPNKVISKNLIGNWDPNNLACYDGDVGGTSYDNLVDGGENLCLVNMDTSPKSTDFSPPVTTRPSYPAYFNGDGSDNYMANCYGDEYSSDNFEIDADEDFTLSVWVDPAKVNAHGTWEEVFIGVGPVNDNTDGGLGVGIIESASDGAWATIASFIPDIDLGGYGSYTGRRAVVGEEGYIRRNKWYQLSLVKQSYNAAFDRVTLYLNGVYQRVPAGSYAGTDHHGEMVPAGYIGGDQQLYVMGMWQTYGGGGAIGPAASLGTSFGHILVYQKALTHSELRQNYLAQKGVYYKFREGL